MGFNISVHSDQTENNHHCNHFLDRNFYNFVNSFSMYGEKSILSKAGEYYTLDLEPLTKLVYTNDEVSQEYIAENIQNTSTLLNLVTNLNNKIRADNSVCDKISYQAYDEPDENNNVIMQEMIRMLGEKAAAPLIEMMSMSQKQEEENPNPWRSYFTDGGILQDLDNLTKTLRCYEEKKVTEIYLTAG